MTLLAKSAFAKHIGVTPGRVTQMISEGKIDGDALHGEGPRAKVVLEIALQQVRARTDVGQRLGNGSKTNLDAEPDLLSGGEQSAPEDPKNFSSSSSKPDVGAVPKQISTADLIQQEKLFKARLDNERETERRLAERGVYVLASTVEDEAVALTNLFIQVLESSVPIISQAMAEEFNGVPMRDANLFISRMFRDVRARLSERLGREFRTMEEFEEVESGVLAGECATGDVASGGTNVSAAATG